jgi:hypothetical protein
MAARIEATHAWLEYLTYQLQEMQEMEALFRLAGP